jgi:hypothetical protein
MSTTQFYENLLTAKPEGFEKQVHDALQNHVGKAHRITLDNLTAKVYKDDLEALDPVEHEGFIAGHERLVREAIETLRRDFRIPVLSQSGVSGRWLAESNEELDETIKELESRHRNLGEVIHSLHMAQVPGVTPQFEKTRQYTIWS